MREAMLYEKVEDRRVRCHLCAHRCLINNGRKGICQVRENREGKLYTLVYGRTITRHVDPIEKKPLFHFFPGSGAYSIATPGCNFRCRWCQNWEISQMVRERHLISGAEATPGQIVAAAQQTGCRSIAYTYTEPTVFFEYSFETARPAHAAGLANVYVTNGYMSAEMLETIRPYLDAANVDLKAFRDSTYRKYLGARLQPVLETMKKMKALGIWVEVTSLVIPGINDDIAELKDAADFVSRELGADTPWHISRFFPHYKMKGVAPTPLETLYRAKHIGIEAGLRYIYVGNVSGAANTVCPGCNRLLVDRFGFSVVENRLDSNGCCPYCGTVIAGVGMEGREVLG